MELKKSLQAIILWLALTTSPIANAKDETSTQIKDVITSLLPSDDIEETKILACKDVKHDFTILLWNELKTKPNKWDEVWVIYYSENCESRIVTPKKYNPKTMWNFKWYQFQKEENDWAIHDWWGIVLLAPISTQHDWTWDFAKVLIWHVKPFTKKDCAEITKNPTSQKDSQ